MFRSRAPDAIRGQRIDDVSGALAAMELVRDIGEGCEPAMAQLDRWIRALHEKDFDVLEDVLAPEFQFTVEPKFGGGRMEKATYVQFNRKIKSFSLDLFHVTARKMGEIVTALAFGDVSEEFEGELPPGMPSAGEMGGIINNARLAYGMGWRQSEDGEWRCVSHHVFGFIQDR
jgi:hypothetical protein